MHYVVMMRQWQKFLANFAIWGKTLLKSKIEGKFLPFSRVLRHFCRFTAMDGNIIWGKFFKFSSFTPWLSKVNGRIVKNSFSAFILLLLARYLVQMWANQVNIYTLLSYYSWYVIIFNIRKSTLQFINSFISCFKKVFTSWFLSSYPPV